VGEGCLLSKETIRLRHQRNQRPREPHSSFTSSHLEQNIITLGLLGDRSKLLRCRNNDHNWTQHFTRIGLYAAFPFFYFFHLARCAAAIFLRADADMVRFTGVEDVFRCAS
jgi:hypothetical protein